MEIENENKRTNSADAVPHVPVPEPVFLKSSTTRSPVQGINLRLVQHHAHRREILNILPEWIWIYSYEYEGFIHTIASPQGERRP